MQWVSDNWVLILLVVGMLAMHLFGHGGHGGKHDNHGKAKADDENDETKKQ